MSDAFLTCAEPVKCADCDFTIQPGERMGLADDGWRHLTCLPEENR